MPLSSISQARDTTEAWGTRTSGVVARHDGFGGWLRFSECRPLGGTSMAVRDISGSTVQVKVCRGAGSTIEEPP